MVLMLGRGASVLETASVAVTVGREQADSNTGRAGLADDVLLTEALMLQTIYEAESFFSTDSIRKHRTPNDSDMHNVNNSVDIKPEVPLALDPGSPLDLRTDVRMQCSASEPGVWERQLQQELLLIQKQQQIQKQLLINEFQKQHENLVRQHQAQIQEHLKLQQELQAMKHHQEQLEKERKLELQSQERELERHRREQQVLVLRNRERSRESAVASTEVKQKLQDFLLSKSTKDGTSAGAPLKMTQSSRLWYTASHHTSLEQSSPPLGGASSSCKVSMPSPQDSRDDFPLRKTVSEPNLKVRSRLKQKVAERRSSPLLRRKEGSIMTPFKKRALELLESTASSSAPGSGPSSPNGACSALGAENGPSSLPVTTRTERWPSQPTRRLLGPESSMSMLNLYTSPSLPNISMGFSAISPPIASFIEPTQIVYIISLYHISGCFRDFRKSMLNVVGISAVMQGLSAQLLGPVPLSVAMETKVSISHQALLQHLLQKEQLRHQKILSTGQSHLHPPSPLAMRDSSPGSNRPKLPRHRPLNRTQSAPLPQSTLAQLVIQQQHQNFLEKQKQYQQQVHINKMLSKSIEQLRQPNVHLQESEEEQDSNEQAMQEDCSPSGGVIWRHSPDRNGTKRFGSPTQPMDIHPGVIRVKEEPNTSDDETLASETLADKQSYYINQLLNATALNVLQLTVPLFTFGNSAGTIASYGLRVLCHEKFHPMPRTLGIGEGTGAFFHSCPLYGQSSSVGLMLMNGETDILQIGIFVLESCLGLRHAERMPEVSHVTLPTHARLRSWSCCGTLAEKARYLIFMHKILIALLFFI
ncbi:Histone deacetylase 9-B [Triplophysa tibetana]|uniref:histone deacetylase n=1 Tax=Triplophysa tibetana TaxID=1572043 RepID=A0A5A9MZ88_9TELE|nr:Histone deacetylase 9-B [Triplophysa tibetana]